MTSEPDNSGGSKFIAMGARLGTWLMISGTVWLVVKFFALVAVSSAKTSPLPNLETGHTFYVHAIWTYKHTSYHAIGYVKPWVGYFHHTVTACGWILLTLFVVLVVVILIARAIRGEWPQPRA